MTALKEFNENLEIFINRAAANIIIGVWHTKKGCKRLEHVVCSGLHGGEWVIGYLTHVNTEGPQFHKYSFLPFYDKPYCIVINGKVFKTDRTIWNDTLTVDQIKIAMRYLETILEVEGLDG